MNLQQRIDLLDELGQYILNDDEEWKAKKHEAQLHNAWFTEEFINLSAKNIATQFLDKGALLSWSQRYRLPSFNASPKTVGIVMAGNIPMVGFHDLLCVFMSGHRSRIKTSSKDDILIPHLVDKLISREESVRDIIRFDERLKGCDAYIATGSNNTSRYFEFYFGKYPHIIRRNRTSVAVLNGEETASELQRLADDVHQFFGFGCRNVTKIYVPEKYDFVPLLNAFKKYNYFDDHNKYKNNYDYNLALQLLNKRYYMTNGTILLVEERSVFSPIGQLNYEYYSDRRLLEEELALKDLQCIVGDGLVGFGQAQSPRIDDYADAVDTMQFLTALK